MSDVFTPMIRCYKCGEAYAAPTLDAAHTCSPATLAVEHYGDALWLCAVRGAGSEPLAHFSSPEAAQRFRVLLAATQASARAAGASGI